MLKKIFALFLLSLFCFCSFAQTKDSVVTEHVDSSATIYQDTLLRIINLNPYFTLHVDSSLVYQLQINKDPSGYFWYLKNSPVGLRISKDNGVLSFKADKSYFMSGKLKYDVNYRVLVGVQNLHNPADRIDTGFTIVFYNTEIITSKVKPTVSSVVWMDEGETLNFKVACEGGSFPIETILTQISAPIAGYTEVTRCNDAFMWKAPYDFVKQNDTARVVLLSFIGYNKFGIKDTAQVKVYVRDALNYPLAVEEYNQSTKNVERYVLQLKYTFLQLDKKLKRTRSARTTFDLTSATTSLTGTILSTSSSSDAQRNGKILPSIGLALVPIKEASVPNRGVDQNQAALIRTSIKRLEYMLRDNMLLGEKDADIIKKTARLREELKQVQVQLIEVPVELTNSFTEAELNRYFNSPKVNKKYRLKSR